MVIRFSSSGLLPQASAAIRPGVTRIVRLFGAALPIHQKATDRCLVLTSAEMGCEKLLPTAFTQGEAAGTSSDQTASQRRLSARSGIRSIGADEAMEGMEVDEVPGSLRATWSRRCAPRAGRFPPDHRGRCNLEVASQFARVDQQRCSNWASWSRPSSGTSCSRSPGPASAETPAVASRFARQGGGASTGVLFTA